MQVAMKVVCKHFLDRDLSLCELDRLTGRDPGLWTWTTQVVTVLHDLGLKVRYHSLTELEPFLEGEAFLQRQFGEETAGIMLKNSNWPVAEQSFRRTMEYDLHTTSDLAFDEIEAEMGRGTVPLMLFDDNVLKQNPGGYRGHFCPITGCSETQVFYHECGPGSPEADRAVDRGLFVRAWQAPGTDKDVILVHGPRAL